ncbi:MAG: sensor domain-containing diguanylate cyclase [Pseudomonas sp.]
MTELRDERPSLRLGQQLEYLLPERPLDFADAALASDWQAVRGSSLSLGYQKQAAWVRLDLRNLAQTRDWRLLVEWPILDRVEVRLYFPASATWGPSMAAGDHLPLTSWPLAERQLVFPLDLPLDEEVQVYLRVSSEENLILPMQLLTQPAFQAQEQDMRLLFGLFFGAMLAILLYNASLYLFTRDKSYIWYLVYLLGAIVYELCLSGIGPLYLWPALGEPARLVYAFSAMWSFLSASLFVRFFLRLPAYRGWMLWSNNLMLAYWSVALLLVLVEPQWLHHIGANLMALFSCILALVVAINLWRRGNPSAPLFALAWGFLILGTFIHVAALEGLLPVNQITLRTQTLGFFVEFILLSVALADRINSERAARIRAQQALIDVQQSANEDLEKRVQERTAALQQATLDLEQANDELTRLSNTDALTQLANRRYVDQQFRQVQGPVLAVLMIDIDHFKQINDSFGHPFGDQCIAAVAGVLREGARRSGDLAARYGGEEFIVLLRDTPQSVAQALAERIRSAVAALQLACQGAPVQLGVSIGLACSSADRPLDVQALLHAADQALYAAKQSGRNQVCCAP